MDLVKVDDCEPEYLDDWILSPVALLVSENKSASASFMPPLSGEIISKIYSRQHQKKFSTYMNTEK